METDQSTAEQQKAKERTADLELRNNAALEAYGYKTESARERLLQDIENRFVYHQPIGTQIGRYQQLRDKAKELALLMAELTPMSREQSLAITKLEESVFFANAAIARNEG